MKGVVSFVQQEIDLVLSNKYLETLAFFLVAIVALIFFLALFEIVTRYNNWQQIKKGNVSVAMATGGKIFGICNIFRFAMDREESIFQSLIWGFYGFVLLVVAYLLFEFLTPALRVDAEIEKDNRAVGFIAMVISIALSYVVGASIT